MPDAFSTDLSRVGTTPSREASIVPGNDAEPSTDAGNLELTGQSSSGLKILIDPPVEVIDGFSASLLLDFDINHTFRPIAREWITARGSRRFPALRTRISTDPSVPRGSAR